MQHIARRERKIRRGGTPGKSFSSLGTSVVWSERYRASTRELLDFDAGAVDMRDVSVHC